VPPGEKYGTKGIREIMTPHLEAVAFSTTRNNQIPLSDRVILALDVETVQEAEKVVQEVGSLVTFYKIGLQLQFNGGLTYAKKLIDEGKKVFLDSKIFDISNTIEKTVENISRMGVHFLTVHGDKQVIEAAAKAKRNQLKVLAVTFLTSLDQNDLRDMHIDLSVEEFVRFRAQLAISAGADGVIASGQETAMIRALAGRGRLTIVTPGVRPKGTAANDQRRTATPKEAIEAGADYLVVGRPVLNAQPKSRMLEKIFSEVEEATSGRHAAA
jgi:orotidine-5'-phosphate decarboxylase